MQVVELRQPDRIRPFLLSDRFFADYALGDLDPAHFQFTEWYGAEEHGELRAVVMLYNDLIRRFCLRPARRAGLS